jgi:hypothetical protein
MKECWHETVEDKPGLFVQLLCSCGHTHLSYEARNRHISIRNYTFTTWSDLGVVWEWGERQKWWGKLWDYIGELCPFGFGPDFVHPIHFPEHVVDFLRSRTKEE